MTATTLTAATEPSRTRIVAGRPPRSAWVEIDLDGLRQNYQRINADKPRALQVLSVIKDDAYGHGAVHVARVAAQAGATFFALGNIEEAVELREAGVTTRLLLFGERQECEFPWCLEYNLAVSVNDPGMVDALGRLAAKLNRRVPVHLKINTGMNRYGVRWTSALDLAERICSHKSLVLEGVMSHFSMSDELDKTFALLQLQRFQEVLAQLGSRGIAVKYRHLCNSGGFLDLPQAHFDMVRIGMLQHGVYPSKVCRRIPGLEPIMTVKARVAAIQEIPTGDFVGYGLRYQAPSPRRLAIIPVGYGDGFPRLRNQGCVLLGGRRAPIVGGIAMDAFMVDVTDIPRVQLWDEAVLMGRQGTEEISVHEVAQWKNTVSYDVLTGWRARLPRVWLGAAAS